MNKVIVITGGSSGIGEAAAKLLADSGYNVVLGARREDKLKAIVDEINSHQKGKAVYQVTDVGIQSEVAALIKKAIDTFGQIDVLYNDAGIMPGGGLEENDFQTWDKVINTNLRGSLYAIGEALPYMIKAKQGQIINMASVLGIESDPNFPVYTGTKWAIRGISESLRKEVAKYNIRVTVISPGVVNTNLIKSMSAEQQKQFANVLPTDSLSPDTIALTAEEAIELPSEASWNEVVIRKTNETD